MPARSADKVRGIAPYAADLLGRARVVDDQLADQMRSLDQFCGVIAGIQVCCVPAVSASAVIVIAVTVCRSCQPIGAIIKLHSW